MVLSVSGNSSINIYEKGDVCLEINPFDNYRLFTLYEDWSADDRKPIDLSGEQTLYLVFKSKNKEIRIPEYIPTGEFTVDKVNGQVLFKINKKNSVDILAMESNVFYITRVYEMVDSIEHKVIFSDEEAIYTGKWKDESSNSKEDFTSRIKLLSSMLEERNNSIKELQESNAQLIDQNVQLATDLEDLKEMNSSLESQVEDLSQENAALAASGMEYNGEIVGEGTYTHIISNKNYTEDEMETIVKNGLEITYKS